MKRMWNYFASILVMGLLAGCSNDTLTGDDSDENLNGSKDAVYMNVSVQLPAGGVGARSETNTPENGDYGTSTSGTEVGQEKENTVSEVLLVLATTSDELIAHSITETPENMTNLSSTSFSTTKRITKTSIAAYYEAANTDANGNLTTGKDEIHVYVFCNPTTALKKLIDDATVGTTAWRDGIAGRTEFDAATTDKKFLMSNAVLAKKKLPKTLADWNDYTTENNAFNLSGPNNYGTDKEVVNNGAIQVERSVARFDFKDGSGKNNTYDVVMKNNAPLMQIQLQKMALVNMSKNFYYLRRVSANGLKDGWNICGVETPSNYVVDTDAAEKNTGIASGFGTYFDYCLGHEEGMSWTIDQTARGQWDSHDISKVLGEGATSDNYGSKEYKIWRYVAENTIPGETSNQKQGITTGVVFKGQMIAPDGADETNSLVKLLKRTDLTGNPMQDPILYTYLTNIYVTWKEVRAAALDENASREFYTAVFGNPENADKICVEKAAEGDTPAVAAVYSTDPKSPDYLWSQWQTNASNTTYWESFRTAAVGSRFTIYQSSKEGSDPVGYYCYYYYWNRHNDNGENGSMGPMEFGVVRNNVYKLAVTKIDRLGHPRISDNDPDPIDPDDPDEKSDVYLTVSVEVLPWTVRINNIEF
ncbi:Mfa1 family fimbria major subunit [Butyricimonas synergistica]|uniref:Mfa1 family fimbria major subunit n=1 Tax=Butyricimonas synergistica TaxID=544644 RepID=UPI000476ECD4|nr:Mfa1 family fimbria major subunit [Butyricimonas synergistica]